MWRVRKLVIEVLPVNPVPRFFGNGGDHLAEQRSTQPLLAAGQPHLAAARVSGLRRLTGAAHKYRTRGRGIGATCLHLAGTAESE